MERIFFPSLQTQVGRRYFINCVVHENVSVVDVKVSSNTLKQIKIFHQSFYTIKSLCFYWIQFNSTINVTSFVARF